MKTSIVEEAIKIFSKASFGDQIISKDYELEVKSKLLNVFHVGDFYYFVLNVQTKSLDFISAEVMDVLGYQPEELDLTTMLSLIHPADEPWFLNYENRVLEFFGTLNVEQIPNYKVRYDYRIRKKEGEYIRILQQIVVLDFSVDGGIQKTFGLHTDISHLKTNGKPVLSLIGLNGEPSFIDIDTEKVFSTAPEFLSMREGQILSMIIGGKESQQIADELFISKETVRTHRKNILKKAKAKNTIDLVSMAVVGGWV